MAALLGSSVATNILRIASNLVLTRLLAPDAFGAVGVIMAVQYFFVMLTDMGFNAFVVRSREGEDPKFLNAVWTTRLVRNGILTSLIVIFSGPLADAFGKPEIQPGIAAAAFVPVLDGLRSISFVVAERQRRVSYLSAVEFAAFLIQTIAAILAAAFLKNYWAIVIAMYVNSLACLVFSYTLFKYSAQKLVFDQRIFIDLWRFAKFVAPSSAITLALTQADKVFIGRNLPLDQFGLYMLASSLTAAARTLIMSWAARMLFPYFSEASRRSPTAVAEIFYLTRRKLALLLALCLGGAVGGGALIAQILFDPRYLEVGSYISLLSLVPLLSLATIPPEMAFVALGRVRAALEGNIIRLIWILIAGPLGFHFGGLFGLVAAFALTELPAAVYWCWRLAEAKILDWKEEALLAATALLGAGLGYGAQTAAAMLIARDVLPDF